MMQSTSINENVCLIVFHPSVDLVPPQIWIQKGDQTSVPGQEATCAMVTQPPVGKHTGQWRIPRSRNRGMIITGTMGLSMQPLRNQQKRRIIDDT